MPWSCMVAHFDFRSSKQRIANGKAGTVPTVGQGQLWFASLLLIVSSSYSHRQCEACYCISASPSFRSSSPPFFGIFLPDFCPAPSPLGSCLHLVPLDRCHSWTRCLVWMDYMLVLLWIPARPVLVHPSTQPTAQNPNPRVLFGLQVQGACAPHVPASGLRALPASSHRFPAPLYPIQTFNF